MKIYRVIFKDRALWFKFSMLTILPIVIVTAFMVSNIMDSVERSMLRETGNQISDLMELTASVG